MTTEAISSSKPNLVAALNQGKYLLGPKLGDGIFSHTYRATQTQSGNCVIIKTTAPFLSQNQNFEQFKQQFLHLASQLITCQHPHLNQVLDYFEEDGQPYIVYAYIAGKTLAEILASGFLLQPDKAIQYMQQIGAALKVLHKAGLYHKDIKPANIKLDSQSQSVILTDFCFTSELTSGIKKTHASLVSLGYAAPEQYEPNTPATGATDIYGLAATLYCLLTGEPPTPPPLREHLPESAWQNLSDSLHRDLKQAISQGLATQTAKRPANITAWLNLLPTETTCKFSHHSERVIVKALPQANHHKQAKKNSFRKHLSNLPLSSGSIAPPLDLDSCLSVRPTKSTSVPKTKANKPDSHKKISPAPELATTATALGKPLFAKQKFPLGALALTSAIAASAGLGFGFAVRANQPTTAGSSFMHRQQAFPPRPGMPVKVAPNFKINP